MASSSVVPTRCCAAALLCSLAALWFCGCWWHPGTTSALHGLLPQQELPHASVKPGSQVPGRAALLEASFCLEGLHPLRCEGRCITWGATEPGMTPGNKPGERQNSKRAFLRAPRRARRDGGTWNENSWVTSEVLDEPQRAKTWHPSQREVPPRKKRLNIFRWNVRKLTLELWQEIQEHVPKHGFDLASPQSTGWSFVSNWQKGGYEIAHCGAQHEPTGGLPTMVKLSLAKEEDLSYCAVIPDRVQHVRGRLVKNCHDLLNVYQHPWRAGYSQDQNLESREAPDHRPPLCSMPADWQPWRREPQCTKSCMAHKRKTHLNIDDQILIPSLVDGTTTMYEYVKYVPMTIVLHLGNANGGHLQAGLRGGVDTWWSTNDMRVAEQHPGLVECVVGDIVQNWLVRSDQSGTNAPRLPEQNITEAIREIVHHMSQQNVSDTGRNDQLQTSLRTRGVLCGQWVFRLRDLLRHLMGKHNEATVRWQMYKRLMDDSPYVPCRWCTAWQPDHECLACVRAVTALDNSEDPYEGPANDDAPFTLPLHEGDPQPGTSLADFQERTLAESPYPRNHAMAFSVRVTYPRGASQLGYADISSRLTRNRVTPGAMMVEPTDGNTKMAEAEGTKQRTSDAMDGTFNEQRLADHRSQDNFMDWLRDSATGKPSLMFQCRMRQLKPGVTAHR